MGAEQSVPYNVENPRRFKDLRCWTKVSADLQKHNKLHEQEIVGNMTAPEAQLFMLGALTAGLEMAFHNSNVVESLNSKWKPWFSVLNNSPKSIQVELWKNWPTNTLESELIIIPSGEIGRLPLPTTVDFNREYPLNPILNIRFIRIFFEDGQMQEEDCRRLNYGMRHMDFVVGHDRTVSVRDEIIVPQPKDEEENTFFAEYNEFISECYDPNCPELTDEQQNQIHALLERCFKKAVESK
jgi:hypothetical protein